MKTICKLSRILFAGSFRVLLIITISFITFENLLAQSDNQAFVLLSEAAKLTKKGTKESANIAIPKLEAAKKLFQEIEDKRGEAYCLLFLGNSYLQLGEYKKTIDFYNQAIPLMRLVGDKSGELNLINNVTKIHINNGENQKSLAYLYQSLTLLREVGDKIGEINTLNGIGNIYSELGNNQKALEYYNIALQLAKSIGDKDGESQTLYNMGVRLAVLGEIREATNYYNQALFLTKLIKDKRMEANILNSIAGLHSRSGNLQKALEYSNQVLTLTEDISDVDVKATTFNNIGEIYSELGENIKALNYYKQAIDVWTTTNNKRGRITTLINMGTLYLKVKEYQKAFIYYNATLPLVRDIGNKSLEATVLNQLGYAHSILGEKQKALTFYNEVVNLMKLVGNKRQEAIALNNIGAIYIEISEYQKALEYYNQALPLAKITQDIASEVKILIGMGWIWYSLGNMKVAAFYSKQSVNLLQQLRSNITGLEKNTQQIYLKSVETAYRFSSIILISDRRFSEAVQVLNLFKDQQFFDFKRELNKPFNHLTQTPREIEFTMLYEKSSKQIDNVSFRFNELKRAIGTAQPSTDETAQLQELESELKTATDAFLAVLKQTETEFSTSADERNKVGVVPDEVEMKTALRNLNQQSGQKTVAVYTLLDKDNFRALIVSPDGIKAVSYPIKATELNDKVLKLWGLLQSDRYDTTVLSKQIYDAVFAPIEKELPKDTTTIMWSLDGNLRYLPMAALFDGKRFLAERYNHVNFTRADGERLTRNVNPNWTGTGFGTSNAQTVELLGDKISFSALPGVTAELGEIFKQKDSKTGILSGEVLPDAKFTKTSFLEAMKRKRPLVHIASHFSFRPGDEARSFLLLGDGTAFTLNEMKAETNLFEGVDLLTLSACNTAAAQADANGREIDGFAELAQRLGAGAVMATLWSVSDASTPWLMRDFYATRQSQAGMTKAEALRKAQLELLGGTAETKPLPNAVKGAGNNKLQIVIVPKGGKRDGGSQTRSDVIYLDEAEAPLYKKDEKKPFAHPYYWSPFILFGNWK